MTDQGLLVGAFLDVFAIEPPRRERPKEIG